MHSFFGSDAVRINTSTSAVLQEGCTNAENPNDLSVYCEQACGPNRQPIRALAYIVRGSYLLSCIRMMTVQPGSRFL